MYSCAHALFEGCGIMVMTVTTLVGMAIKWAICKRRGEGSIQEVYM